MRPNSDEVFWQRLKLKIEAQNSWLSRNNEKLNRYLDYISLQQTRRLFRIELICSVILLGIIVNLLSEGLFIYFTGQSVDFVIRNNNGITIIIISLLLSIPFVGIIMWIQKKYAPSKRTLILNVDFQECTNYMFDNIDQNIHRYIISGDFNTWSCYANKFLKLFDNEIRTQLDIRAKAKIKELDRGETIHHTVLIDDFEWKFPEKWVTYDISSISDWGVICHLKVNIHPQVLLSVVEERNPTVRDIIINFIFDIGNPEHSRADDFINEAYWSSFQWLPRGVSLCIEEAFHPLIDSINPVKIKEG